MVGRGPLGETIRLLEERLLRGFASALVELTVTKLFSAVPAVTELSTTTPIVMFATPPEASEVNETVRSLPDPPQTPPPVALQDTNEVPPTRVSRTVTCVAASGPLFRT